MGINEYGVAIGNEAVWTNQKYRKEGLLGMDLLRLALERAKTARAAVNVITDLLEEYHQGGWCDEVGSMIYHNSFLIADSRGAWVLETADDWWVAEEVTDGVRNISNDLSIAGRGDLRSDGLIDWAIDQHFCDGFEDFSFARTFSESGWTTQKSPFSREGRCNALLNSNFSIPANAGIENVKKMISILRDHEGGICMHNGFISAGSQVSSLSSDPTKNLNLFTITAPPCKSVYLPFTFDASCKGFLSAVPFSEKSDEWLWMNHRKLAGSIEHELIDNLQEKVFYDLESITSSKQVANIHNRAFKEYENLLRSRQDYA